MTELRPLHWSVPILFVTGLFFGVFGASGRWPDVIPWGAAFWMGWLAHMFFAWQCRKAKANGESTTQGK